MSILVYALATGPAAPATGLCGEVIRHLSFGSWHAAVGDVTSALSPDAQTIRRYDALIRTLAETSPALLPARFGSLVDDDATLGRLLAPRTDELTRALEHVTGCVQMTLRIFGPPRPSAAATATAASNGTAYLRERLERKRRAATVPELESVRARLAAWVKDERVTRHDASLLVASVCHLIPRDAAAPYVTAITESAFTEGVRVTVSGPWAPYAFGPESLS